MKYIVAGVAVIIATSIFPQMNGFIVFGISPFYALGGWWVGWGLGDVQGRGWDWRW